MQDAKITTLANGIRVVAAPLKERKSISVGIWVHTGGRDESADLSGVSHFLEHLVFKRTKTRSANDIKESVEGVGGSLNAFTSEEYTCFLAKCAQRNFDQVFDVLSDMVLNASLTSEDIKKERTVILEEIKMTQDQPSEMADELLTEIVWPDHALGRPIAGTLKSVSALTQAQIKNYRDQFYEPGLITVVAAGSVDSDTLTKMAQKYFGARKNKNNKKKIHLFDKTQKYPASRIVEKKTEQTHLSLGLHSLPKSHPDEYALDMLHVILGGNMSSRLFNEVREERGLAYEIGTFLRKYNETGAFGVNAGIDNNKVEEALHVIVDELNRIKREPVKADELKRAKEFYLGQLDLGLESTMNQMLWAGESVISLGRIRSYEEVSQGVQKVTPDKLKAVASDLFKTQKLNLAIVGPKLKKIDKIFKNLSFSP